MAQLFQRGGGYRCLDVFMMASIIDYATNGYCERFLPYTQDAQGKQRAQMLGAARSARQNIIEATERGTTSRETEMRLLEVSRGSLAELIGDFEMMMRRKDIMPWRKEANEYLAVSGIVFERRAISDDDLYGFRLAFDAEYAHFVTWLDSPDEGTVANAIAVLCFRAIAMLRKLTEKKFSDFREEGGFKERLTQERKEARNAAKSQPPAPACPTCGKPMVLKTVQKGERKGQKFWGCCDYPTCKGTRNWGP